MIYSLFCSEPEVEITKFPKSYCTYLANRPCYFHTDFIGTIPSVIRPSHCDIQHKFINFGGCFLGAFSFLTAVVGGTV